MIHQKVKPGALAGATGAGFPNIATQALRNKRALAHRLAPFAALDPATLAALGLVAARLWGAALGLTALAWGNGNG